LDLDKIHHAVLYPVVRVRTGRAGGSGVVIYSHPVPGEKATRRPEHEVGSKVVKYETYIVTCHHVVNDAITFVHEWSDIARRDIKVEKRKLVTVETFEYEELSRCTGGTTYKAEIIAWDNSKDIAILKVRTSKRFENVVKLYPRGKADGIKLGTPMLACGCSLGHEPFFTKGDLVAKHDRIQGEEYWMTTANTVFGNSGGPVFLDTFEYIGNSARISAIQLGFGHDIMTWMGFFVPIEEIYKIFDKKYLQFLYDPKTTSVICERKRKARQKKEEKKLLMPAAEEEDSSSEKGDAGKPDPDDD